MATWCVRIHFLQRREKQKAIKDVLYEETWKETWKDGEISVENKAQRSLRDDTTVQRNLVIYTPEKIFTALSSQNDAL